MTIGTGRYPRKSAMQSVLGVIALCLLAFVATLSTVGCTGASVAQTIVNWTPALDSAASTIATIDPALVPEAKAFVVFSNDVDTQATAYLANPSAGVLVKLQAAIVIAQQQASSSLLAAVGITDAATRTHVLAAIQSYGTIANTLLALVQTISSKAAVARMAADSPIKLAMVRPYMDERRLQPVALRYGTTVDGFFANEARAGF